MIGSTVEILDNIPNVILSIVSQMAQIGPLWGCVLAACGPRALFWTSWYRCIYFILQKKKKEIYEMC